MGRTREPEETGRWGSGQGQAAPGLRAMEGRFAGPGAPAGRRGGLPAGRGHTAHSGAAWGRAPASCPWPSARPLLAEVKWVAEGRSWEMQLAGSSSWDTGEQGRDLGCGEGRWRAPPAQHLCLLPNLCPEGQVPSMPSSGFGSTGEGARSGGVRSGLWRAGQDSGEEGGGQSWGMVMKEAERGKRGQEAGVDAIFSEN